MKKHGHSKTYQFVRNGKVISIVNLTEYARHYKLSQASLWQVASGAKKAYGGLESLPEVYRQKQQELDNEVELRSKTEFLYPYMTVCKHLGTIKYRYNRRCSKWKDPNGRSVINKISIDKQTVLEYALIANSILDDER